MPAGFSCITHPRTKEVSDYFDSCMLRRVTERNQQIAQERAQQAAQKEWERSVEEAKQKGPEYARTSGTKWAIDRKKNEMTDKEEVSVRSDQNNQNGVVVHVFGHCLEGSAGPTVNGAIEGFGGDSIFATTVTPSINVTITIGATGDVYGFFDGIYTDATSTITNMGWVGGGIGIVTNEQGKITNTGQITGGIDGVELLGSGNVTVTNSGIIKGGGSYGVFGNESGILTISNTGTISGGTASLFINQGTAHVTNHGSLNGVVMFDTVGDTLNNSGTVTSGVSLGAASDTLTNSGSIGGVTVLAALDTIANTGTIGSLSLTGFGTLFTDSGGGHVTGDITITGTGLDTINGGSSSEFVVDSTSVNDVHLGGGNDTYQVGFGGTPGNDTVDGGTGTNTFDASGATNGVSINLDTVSHTYGVTVSASTASGADFTAGSDHITHFETAIGGNGNDVLIGGAGPAHSLTATATTP